MARLCPAWCAALLLLSSCAAAGIGTGPEVLETEEGLKVLVAAATDGGMDAQTRGRLLDVGGCLGAALEGITYVAVWPHGTDIAGEAIRIEGVELALGDSFSGGGGYLDDAVYADEFPTLPEECLAAADTDEVMWVQRLVAD